MRRVRGATYGKVSSVCNVTTGPEAVECGSAACVAMTTSR